MIGLHPKDNLKTIETPQHLRDLGNTLTVVEHDVDTMGSADHVVEIGLEKGHRGGEVTAGGTPEQSAACRASHTGWFLQACPVRTQSSRSFVPGDANVLW